MKSIKENKRQKLSDIKNGDIFKIGEKEFIKISDSEGATVAILKDTAFYSDFGPNNNLSNMKIIERLEEEFLPNIISEIGEENVLEFDTDLTSLDGVKTYGKITSKVSLPTLDFCRKHVEIFDNHKLDDWWWLATPWSAIPHYNSSCILCVSPSGFIYDYFYYDYFGVRPVLHFVSSIFVS